MQIDLIAVMINRVNVESRNNPNQDKVNEERECHNCAEPEPVVLA